MRCIRCNANEIKYFEDNVCRRCLHLNHGIIEVYDHIISDMSEYKLDFELNVFQKKISREIVKYNQDHDIYLEAVCGAGKTEMCYELIKESIKDKKVVAWAIPRRQVVLELKDRIAKDFQDCKVVAVCEGYTEDVLGDIIICTTHQLYRYPQMLDVLIVDEPDAFPFSGNALLVGLMRQSIKGKIVFMSATKDENMLELLDNPIHLKMPLRPNLKPIPVPIKRISSIHFILDYLRHIKEKQLIFVPTIRKAELLSKIMRIPYITSKSENKEEIIQQFIQGKNTKLISTTILERGVTFLNVFVHILWAEHPVFDESSLTQISGRVLRGKSTKGACYLYAFERCVEVEKCIRNLNLTNQHAASVLKKGSLDISS